MKALKIKVCGMRDAENILQVKELNPDYLGFIFYQKSPRYLEKPDKVLLDSLQDVKKAAVFVNENLSAVKTLVNDYHFDAVQLHGNESPEFCMNLKKEGVKLI